MKQTLLEAQLDKLLMQDISSVKESEKSMFDKLSSPYNSFIIFGAGELGREILACLREAGVEPLAFSDNNPAIWNTSIEGLTVLAPEEAAKKFGTRAAFVVAIWHYSFTFNHVKQQLSDLQCARIIPCLPLMWKFQDKLLPHYCLDLPSRDLEEADRIREVFHIWADESSRRNYVSFLRWRQCLDFDGLPEPVGYFPEDLFRLSQDTVFVDCGAFDGDTVRDFIERRAGSFRKIFAFEPDPSNFQKLKASVSSYPESTRGKICIFHAAAGERKSQMRFNATGTQAATIAERGGFTVDCIPLDDVIENELHGYVKMDVEGGELNVLKGARRTIKKASVIWAVTTEHRYNDLWQLPHFIHSVSQEYRFYLRPHSYEGLDLVCYAVPKKICTSFKEMS